MAHKVKGGGLEALRDDPFLDLTIKCNDKSWKVHKTHFAGESEALAGHLSNNMKEGTENMIELNDYFPQAIEALIYYQYLGKYDEIGICQSYIEAQGPDTCDALASKEAPQPVALSPAEPWKTTPIASAIKYPSFSRLSKGEVTDILLVNGEMYRLGDIFCLPDLRATAAQKVIAAEESFMRSEFGKVLQYLWDNTAEDDNELRFDVFSRCMLNHATISRYREVEAKVKELIGSTVWEAIKKISRVLATSQERETSALAALSDSMKSLAQEKRTSDFQAAEKNEKFSARAKRLERSLGAVKKALKTSEATVSELSNGYSGLREDLADVQSEWHRNAQIECTVCRKWVGGMQWEQDKDEFGRLHYRCQFCGTAFASAGP